MTTAILVTRAAGQADDLVSALRDAGLNPVSVPAIEVELEPPGSAIDRAAGLLHTYRWVVITSVNGARSILKAAERIRTELGAPGWAVIGTSTRAALEREGIEVGFEPSRTTGRALAAELPIEPGDWVLIVRGSLAGESLAEGLRERGAQVDDVIAYQTREAPEGSRGLLRAMVAGGPIAAVMFASGSAVRGFLSLGLAEGIDVRSLPAVCIGPETADEAQKTGFRVLAVSPIAAPAALAAVAANVLARRPEATP